MSAQAQLSFMEQPYSQGRENFEDIVGYLDCREASSMTHSELERELEKKGRELMRCLLEEHLQRRGQGQCETPVCGADGVERNQHRPQQRHLETIFGTVELPRIGYGHDGVASLHPLDAELNLPDELYSLQLRRRVAEEAAKTSFEQVTQTIANTTGAQIAKRQAAELVVGAAVDFDDFYRQRQAVQTDSALQIISVDGKGIVMRKQDLREKTRQAAEARTHKMGKRLSRGEKKNAKRMATVAAVYEIAPFVRTPEQLLDNTGLEQSPRPRPQNKRVWASVEKKPEEVIAEALAEARRRDPAVKKTRVALVDGNRSQIRQLRRMARKEKINLIIVVDIIHVTEYLWNAGRAFYPESGPQLESWVGHRLAGILRGKAAAMAGGMRRSATLKGLSDQARKPVDACATYLLNQTPYLHYDSYLAQGLPIATGVIEGACRHLVKDRMDVTGARWGLTGAEAVLKLRALRSSDDFDEYWRFHEACEYQRTHPPRYAGSVVPKIVHPHLKNKKPRLKVIK